MPWLSRGVWGGWDKRGFTWLQHFPIVLPPCVRVVVWKMASCCTAFWRKKNLKKCFCGSGERNKSLTPTNMFLLQGPSAEGQACCLETKRSPSTTEITQTRCDICSSAVATSRTGAWRGTLLSGCSEKEAQSKYGQFQSHIAFCHALLTQPWHHKSWNNTHLISLNLVYLKWDFCCRGWSKKISSEERIRHVLGGEKTAKNKYKEWIWVRGRKNKDKHLWWT